MFSNFKIKTIAFIYIIFLFSCNRDKNKSDNIEPLSISYNYLEESVKPFKFKTGSYWVFKNDTSGILDSIIVQSIQNDYYWSNPPVHGNAGTKAEFYKINLQSFYSNTIYNDYLTYNFIKRNGGNEYGTNGQPIYITNSPIGYGFNGMSIYSKLTNITINSHNFSNVDVSKITATNQFQIEFIGDTYLYFSDSIGLIKKVTELNGGNVESWSLLRWNVIK